MENTQTLRWGVIGAGHISSCFIKDLLLKRPDQDPRIRHHIQAIASSSAGKSANFIHDLFANEEQKPTAHGTYQDLYADEDVDIVYVSIPNSLHKQACLDAITAGKHVLCEKPLAVNASEVDEITAAATAKGAFLMEAVWTRFLPSTKETLRLIHEEQVIGKVTRLFCDFSFQIPLERLPPTHRLLDPGLGAGALLDLGVYPLTWASLLLDSSIGDAANNPSVSSSLVVRDGVDHADAMILQYPHTGALAILTSSFLSPPQAPFCRIEGTLGTMTLSGANAACATALEIERPGQPVERRTFEHEGMGLYFEADAVALDIQAGRLQSPTMSLLESRRILSMMDDVRRSAGVVFPQDQESSEAEFMPASDTL